MIHEGGFFLGASRGLFVFSDIYLSRASVSGLKKGGTAGLGGF